MGDWTRHNFSRNPWIAKSSTGRTKLTSPVREQLNKMAAEARFLACGEAGCSAWGTKFAEIEDDAKEVGYEFIRLLMQQTADGQTEAMPAAALTANSGKVAQSIGTEECTIETESGPVIGDEPKTYLPKSRKDFFSSGEGTGLGRWRSALTGSDA